MKIEVNPTDLVQSAGVIDQLAGNYSQIYNALYSDVSALQAGWKGKDNQAFTDQIAGFRDDFEKMQKLMNEYAVFLRDAANRYQTTQDNVASAARRLTN